ncbi:GNAT family N-acetyltransferase [Endozoicomonas elysicola]|uniref:Acetyltransferase n=1 Tax=Endozoicomonas elysicola TaxID=305900 RepID=A0A081K8S3_9GAMM|nr:GNAT family N-acetyltransferase [Endozoicomonas elysicola]KEI70549.1 acetyltransferase [Endozoicomonas elysicola]
MIIPTLETDRLILRGFNEQDVEPYAQMCADPEVMKYIGTGQTLSSEESWRGLAMLIGHWELRRFGMWAVEEKLSGQFVGRVGLYNPEGWPGIEVGWALAREYWGKGYATEAAHRSVQWGFENTGADALISLIIPENTASINVSERIGQRFSKAITIKGVNANLYSLNKQSTK